MQAVDFRRAQQHLENNFVRYRYTTGDSWWITNNNKTIIRLGNEDLSIYDSLRPCNKDEKHHHDGLDTEGKFNAIHRFLYGYHEGENARKQGIFHNYKKRELHEELLKRT